MIFVHGVSVFWSGNKGVKPDTKKILLVKKRGYFRSPVYEVNWANRSERSLSSFVAYFLIEMMSNI